MAMRKPEEMTQPHPPPLTRRLDQQQVWREGEGAIIIPILYDLLDSTPNVAEHEVLIAPIISPPSPPVDLAVSSSPPNEIVPQQKKEESPLPSSRREAELITPPALTSVQPHPDSQFIFPSDSTFSRTHRLSTAVPLLLLGGVALVLLAWFAFR